MAERSGLSLDQQKQAVRVANVPAEKFEAAIERPKPATLTKLAEMGRQVRAVSTDGFKRATQLIGAVKRFTFTLTLPVNTQIGQLNLGRCGPSIDQSLLERPRDHSEEIWRCAGNSLRILHH
jgi:hypothetical protein